MAENLSSQERYYQFLGRFMGQFARTEEHLRRVLLQLSNLDEPYFRVLVGFPRTKDAVAKIRQLIAIIGFKPEGVLALDGAFRQLSHISDLRDNLVHYGGFTGPPETVILRVKPTEMAIDVNEDQRWYSFDELEAAINDLSRFHFTITYILDAYFPEALRPSIERIAMSTEPCQYKPVLRPPEAKETDWIARMLEIPPQSFEG